jgi:hypothetical protein
MSAEFENQLQRQSLRQPPPELRSQILRAASLSTPRNRCMPLIEWVSGWLWPHPRAWVGLAAAWVLICVLHFTSADEPRVAGGSQSMTVQSLEAMQKQTLIMSQLLGSLDGDDQPSAAIAPPKPRSEAPRKQRIG